MALIGTMKYLTIGDKTYEIDSGSGGETSTWYGTSSTTASTAEKTITCSEFTLSMGAIIAITFTTANTANAPKLNINSTGAKAIYYNNVVTSSSNKLVWDANETLLFVYSGTYYYFIGKSKLISKTSELTNDSGFITGGSNANSAVVISPKTTNMYPVTSAGSVTSGTANTPTVINTAKFSGGSFTRGSFSGGSFTQGTDSFTSASLSNGFYSAGSATTPATIDTTKFNGGSYSHTGFNGGSFTRGTFSGGYLSMSIDGTDTKKLNISFSAATHAADSFTSATYGTDSFTSAAFQTGFYTAGTKGNPTTIDVTKFNGGSFTQGTDSFTSATHGNDNFTSAAFQSGFYTSGTANIPTAVTLPSIGASSVAVWTGYNSGVSSTYAEAQAFTGSSS